MRSIAEQKLRDQKRLHRGASPSSSTKKVLTFGDALQDYRHTVDTAVNTKGSSKEYREQTIEALLRSWPGLAEIDTRKITEHQCLDWGARFSNLYSGSRYNNTLGTLRGVLQIGVDSGYLVRNAGMGVGKVHIVEKPLTFHLPVSKFCWKPLAPHPLLPKSRAPSKDLFSPSRTCRSLQ